MKENNLGLSEIKLDQDGVKLHMRDGATIDIRTLLSNPFVGDEFLIQELKHRGYRITKEF